MIAVKHVKAVLGIELGKHPENIAVRFYNLTETAVFPQLVTVTELNIGEALYKIVLQCSEIQVLVFEKIIVGGACSAVAVTDNNILAEIIEREP